MTPCRSAAAALLALSLLAPRLAGAEDAPAHAYRIDARLDAERHVVAGTAEIAWTNQSDSPAGELWLHLYMNAFEDRDTVFMRESRGQLRGVPFRAPGSIRLAAIWLDGHDLLPESDDEIIEDDRTQLRVPLPSPVPPGASITLEIPFETTLPLIFARAGYVGELHMVAQWFPKLARLEPTGTWTSFPYHGLGEFYADFARYEVTLDLPADHVVGATGVEVEVTREGDRTIHRFVAENVHDFAFASDPRFEAAARECHGVEVRVLSPPGYEATAARARRVSCAGLAYFGRLYGPYPHPVLTIVVPPRGAAGAAGMEYPALFTTDGGHLTLPGVHFGGVDDTTAHELAHQWFQGIVATDEVRFPMLDEGLTSWAGYDLQRELFGSSTSFSEVPALDYFEVIRSYVFVRGDPPAARPVTAFSPGAYGRVIYGRVPLLFETLARTYGRHRVHQALGDYARSHRFAHPVPADLLAAIERAFGAEVVEEVVRPALFEGADAAAGLVREGDAIVAVRRGDIALPTRGTIRCRDGRAIRFRWPTDARRFLLPSPESCEPAEARIDPGRTNLLDPKSVDDHVVLDGTPRWAGQALAWAFAILASFGP